MSAAHLPEDLSQWPDDPAVVLGLGGRVDRREVRRAYAALIRIFKPEQYPLHFRRLRDAYEALLVRIQYSGDADGTMDLTPPDESQTSVSNVASRDPTPLADDEQLRPAFEPADPDPLSNRRRSAVADPSGDAWRLAEQGDIPSAYRRLCELHRQQPENEDACLRLYWLLRLMPDCDPNRDRRDWLLTGLRHHPGDYGLLDLYGGELDDDPLEALNARGDVLLRLPIPLELLPATLQRRWNALQALGAWQRIVADIDALRTSIPARDRCCWLRLLSAALQRLVWETDPAAREAVELLFREISAHPEDHFALEWDLDRCDFVQRLASAWNEIRNDGRLPDDCLELLDAVLRPSTNATPEACFAPLMDLLEPLMTDPLEALGWLELLHRNAPIVLCHLLSLLKAVSSGHPAAQPGLEPDAILAAVGEFIRSSDWGIYDAVRRRLILHCLTQHLTTDEVLEALPRLITDQQLAASGLAHKLGGDLPAAVLSWAARASGN